MRPRLLERREGPRRRRGHDRRAPASRGRHGTAPVEAAPAVEQLAAAACDPDVEKVRRAGGPRDEAVYACACGYVFSAAVSTTVGCPHCGVDQAW